jgi:hypothetical protein
VRVNGSPCQPYRPPTVTPLSHYLMATWDDAMNLLCGQELHNDVTSPHHITSNVRILTLPLHDFHSSVFTNHSYFQLLLFTTFTFEVILLCDTKICLFNQQLFLVCRNLPIDVFALSLFAMPCLTLPAYHIETIMMT